MRRSDIILLLLKPSENEGGIVGTTRLQKLLFLLEKEGKVTPTKEQFDFVPYKFGPASKRLYDDLEFLTNLGLITRSDQQAFEIEEGSQDIDSLTANDLLATREDAPDSPKNNAPDLPQKNDSIAPEGAPSDSVVYSLTDRGLEYLRESTLLMDAAASTADMIKRKYSRYSLNELLSYVYSKYPDFTVESEIRDRFGA